MTYCSWAAGSSATTWVASKRSPDSITDPFLAARPNAGHSGWPGPRLLACGDLHHGPDPIGTLQKYRSAEPQDAVLLTFNPALLKLQARLPMPVRCLAPVSLATHQQYPSHLHA